MILARGPNMKVWNVNSDDVGHLQDCTIDGSFCHRADGCDVYLSDKGQIE